LHSKRTNFYKHKNKRQNSYVQTLASKSPLSDEQNTRNNVKTVFFNTPKCSFNKHKVDQQQVGITFWPIGSASEMPNY